MNIPKLKHVVKQTIEHFGYTIRKVNASPPDTISSQEGYAIFAPWNQSPFQENIYRKIRKHTVVSADRAYIIERLSTHCTHLPGDFAECGVYKGGTAYLIAHVMKRSHVPKQLHLFDTFSGMPDIACQKSDGHQEGDFNETSLHKVTSYLSEFPNVTSYAGIIPSTFQHVQSERFSFVHIDVDLYQTTMDCCKYFYPRLVRGAIMIFDDYGFTYYKDAEKKAVDEFFAEKEETLLSLPTGQCIVIKV